MKQIIGSEANGINPTTSLDLEPWLISLSVRQESPVVSLLVTVHVV
jgi:hypothetical protein